MKPLSIGIIGAGAATEVHHLPAAQACPEIRITALVDINQERAKALAERFGVKHVMADYTGLFGQVDGVLVAVPHYLHAPMTLDFLEKCIPVLVEKPMALTEDDAKRMVSAARANGVVLQVGNVLRFVRAGRLLRRLIAEGWLGRLQDFSLEAGCVFNWPVASRFLFNKQQAGGGVLADLGSHFLDLLLWWLGDVVEMIEYRDDSLGGVEAECWLSLVLRSPTGPVQGVVTLSRLRQLSDTVLIHGERFSLRCQFSEPDRIHIMPNWPDDACQSFVSAVTGDLRASSNIYTQQLRAFARSISCGGPSIVTGESVLGSIALIERCYAERQPLEMPWTRSVTPSPQALVKA